jgi:small multidrug resistance pump
MPWLYLLLGILLDVAGTVFLKLSNGLSRTLPAALMVLCYVAAFAPMSLALREMQVSVFYAAWSSVGTLLIAVIGVVYFKEPATAPRLISFGLIIAGTVMLNMTRGK